LTLQLIKVHNDYNRKINPKKVHLIPIINKDINTTIDRIWW
jgi:hypothetical protein